MATICLSGDVIIKAGTYVGAVPNAAWDGYIEQAEDIVSAVSRYDYVTNWATISGNATMVKQVVEDLAAIYGIEYDMSGYSTRGQAQDMINILRDAALRGMSLLRDQKGVTFGK